MVSAQKLLRKGMESLSQAEVGSALQVYFNLGELREVGGQRHLAHCASAPAGWPCPSAPSRLIAVDGGWSLTLDSADTISQSRQLIHLRSWDLSLDEMFA